MKKIYITYILLLLSGYAYATKYAKRKLPDIHDLKLEPPIKKKTPIQKCDKKKSPPHINVFNTLTKDKITYQKHWYKPVPTLCHVTINDQPILTTNSQGDFTIIPSIALPAGEKLVSHFEWRIEKFGKVWHHEKKEVVYELDRSKKEFTLDFDWESKERLKITNAKLICCKEIIK